jgi:hypothetical protein
MSEAGFRVAINLNVVQHDEHVGQRESMKESQPWQIRRLHDRNFHETRPYL